ncbi:MAG: class I SAM-dependent methyltransferase, partial [Bdellovibrionales bacterium]|nr:class I SAM-dependent methyltransferase [Bdellovibrionales bacterium]
FIMTSDRSEMSAWGDDSLTRNQLAWVQQEAQEVQRVLGVLAAALNDRQPSVADIGCGDARIAARLHSLHQYVGFDIDAAVIDENRTRRESDWISFWNAGDFRETLPAAIKQRGRPFDLVIMTGNTLGTLGGDPTETLRVLAAHGDAMLVSVVQNQPEVTIERLRYYQKNGFNCCVNWTTGTITSEFCGGSFAWSRHRLTELGSSLRDLGHSWVEVREVPPLGYALVTRRK